MKKVTLLINAALYAQLGLSDSADDAAVGAAIAAMADKANKADQLQNQVDTLKTEKTQLETDLKNQKAEGLKGKVKTLLDTAKNEGKITEETAKVYEEQYAETPDALEKVLNTLKAYKPFSNNLNKDGEEKSKDDLAKEYDTLHASGKLQACKKDTPERYEQLFEAKFGKKPRK